MKEIKQSIWIQHTVISVLDPDPVGYVSFGWIQIRQAKKIVINSHKNQRKLKEYNFFVLLALYQTKFVYMNNSSFSVNCRVTLNPDFVKLV